MKKYPLRAGDAIHLAAAVSIYHIYGKDLYFVSDDIRQCEAASSEGMDVLKPTDGNAFAYLQRLQMHENDSTNA